MSRPAKFSLAAAFACAGRGVWLMTKGRNGRLQLAVGVIAVIAGFAFRISSLQWLAIIGSITLVLSLETMNTAIERVVDLASPGYHDLARDAKDLAAGAVLIASIASIVIGLIVFVPHILSLL